MSSPSSRIRPLVGGVDAGDDLGQGGLTAAVWAGDGHKPFVNGQIDVPQDAFVLSVLLHIIADML